MTPPAEPVNPDVVGAKIAPVDESVFRIGVGCVRVRGLLSQPVRARAAELGERDARSDPAVCADGKAGDAARAVTGHEDFAAGLVETDVAGVATSRGLLV